MALSFLPDSDLTLDVVVTCDPAVVATEEQAQAYLVSGPQSLRLFRFDPRLHLS